MEKSNERLGYHTMKAMSRDPPLCECACAHPRCSLSGLPSSRDDERSQSSFRIRMAMDTHTQSHTQSNEEFPSAASPINQEMN